MGVNPGRSKSILNVKKSKHRLGWCNKNLQARSEFAEKSFCPALLSVKKVCAAVLTVGWFESYLSNRMQQTSCGSELSDALPVTFGVPRGSILGPLLFLVYRNGLPSITNKVNVSLYTDDTVLYYYASDVNDLERNLNEDLLKLAIWLNENKLN
jgi:hypothetical protein